MTRSRLHALAAVLLLSTGCSRLQLSDAACPSAPRAYRVLVSGGFSSSGTLTVGPSRSQGGVYDLVLEVFGAGPQRPFAKPSPVIVIRAVGACEHGIVRARFGGGAGENAQYRVLGGVVESLLDPALIPRPFGAWDMHLLDKQTQQKLNLVGFWEALPDLPRRAEQAPQPAPARASSG